MCLTVILHLYSVQYNSRGLIRIKLIAVSIGTRYGLDGTGIESRGGRYSGPTQTGPGAHPAFYTMGTGSFLGVKRPGPGVDHPPHLAPSLKEEYSYIRAPPLGLRGLF